MKQAKKIMVSKSMTFEVGVNNVDHINISYPLARIYTKDDAIPVREIILPIGTDIVWLEDD